MNVWPLISKALLVWGFISWPIFLLANHLYNLIRNIYWISTGVYWRHVDPGSYDNCLHVMNVVFKYRLDPWIQGKETDFVLTHDRFEQPEFLLRDDVSLYSLTETHAIFLQAAPDWPKPCFMEDFYILGQFPSAVKVIRVPLKYFNKFAETMEGDGGKIIFLQNQARCGGTLLTSLFKETGKCVTFCEPHCLNWACYHIFTTNKWHGEYAKRMFRNTVRVLCKPYNGFDEKVLAYVIKPTVLSIVSSELAHEAFPDCYQFFMYRDPVVMAISLRKVGEVLNTLKLLYTLPNLPSFTAFLMRLYRQVDVDYRKWTCAIHPELEFGYRATCFTTYHYLRNLKRGVNIRGIRYAHLTANKEKMVSLIFKACDLPDELSVIAKEALNKDSQKFSPVSQDILKKVMPNPPKATPRFLEVARALSEEYGAPPPEAYADEKFHLKNSILPDDKL